MKFTKKAVKAIAFVIGTAILYKAHGNVPVVYEELVVLQEGLYNDVARKIDSNHRSLTINLGGGNCKWQPPTYEIPEDIDFYKTMVVGFPSGDKRMTFVQMEALTGWAAKDEWDFEYLGTTNNPFIKANYPHHEGIWGWGDAGDQVLMVVRNIRRSMVDYHDILWDIGYAKTWGEASLLLANLYAERPPLEAFLEWRDLRVIFKTSMLKGIEM